MRDIDDENECIANALEGLIWPNMAIGNKVIIKAAIEALRKDREKEESAVCPKCGNTGLADSGGVQPWGEPILIECDCTAPPAPVVPAETFDEWSRRCEIQLTLCRQEFREVAEITWNACCAAMLNHK